MAQGQARVEEVKPLLQRIKKLGGDREAAYRKAVLGHDRLNPDNPALPEDVAP